MDYYFLLPIYSTKSKTAKLRNEKIIIQFSLMIEKHFRLRKTDMLCRSQIESYSRDASYNSFMTQGNRLQDNIPASSVLPRQERCLKNSR